MLNKRNLRILGLIFLASVVSLCAYVSFHSAFYACINEASSSYSAQHQDVEHQSVSAPFLYGYAGCANRIARRDSEAITALSTALLTFVTLGLVLLGIEQSDTTRAELRAYVLHNTTDLFDGTGRTTGIDRTGQPGATTKIINCGQTLAYAVRHRSYIEVAVIGDAHKMSVKKDLRDVGGTILGPNGTGSMTASRWLLRPLTPEEIAGIKSGTHAIFVYGRIEYLDAWKSKHWTTYRLQYTQSAWPPIIQPASMNFSIGGNDAD